MGVVVIISSLTDWLTDSSASEKRREGQSYTLFPLQTQSCVRQRKPALDKFETSWVLQTPHAFRSPVIRDTEWYIFYSKVQSQYTITYPSKNTAKHQWSKAWPHQLAPLYIHTSLFAGGYGSNMFFFLHMCGVNQFWIIVFFTAVKPANNILFCIELIQRPESSLRRHKLGLTDQSIHSNDDKTRFTCVHRLMTTGHSQNICRKVPDDVASTFESKWSWEIY